MPAQRSSLRPGNPAFVANLARMAERPVEVRTLEAQVAAESASKADKFAKRGQLLPRERVAPPLDRDSGCLELSALAGLGLHDDDGKKNVMGGGSIVGIGTVAGKRVLISASDSALKGGTVSPMGLRKALRAQDIAAENRWPLIYLAESGGANLMVQSERFVEGGRAFANQARLSAAGIPQIAVVHGASTAGGAYLPGLSDYVVLVKGRSSITLAGPPTTARPATCARSSPGWSTAPTSSNSSPPKRPTRCAAMPASPATGSASSATTARSSPPAAPRRHSSSSCATRAARRWSSCRTPPAPWWAGRPRPAVPSSTAAR
jgi:hypothetical protein